MGARGTREEVNAYNRRHAAVRRAQGKAATHSCVKCGCKAQEWAQIHGEDGYDPWADYIPLCCSCHQKYDNHWSDEARTKVGAWSKNKWTDAEYRASMGPKITAAKTGLKYNWTPEGLESIRESHRGKRYAAGKRTPEQCARIREGRWGKKEGDVNE
jgi:hypothetical protein